MSISPDNKNKKSVSWKKFNTIHETYAKTKEEDINSPNFYDRSTIFMGNQNIHFCSITGEIIENIEINKPVISSKSYECNLSSLINDDKIETLPLEIDCMFEFDDEDMF